MASDVNELKKRNVLRLSNEESNRITKECIQTALINILSQKNLDDITISEIVSKAGVSRSAFYRNYKTKADVLEEISDNYIKDLYKLCWQAICEKDTHSVFKDVFSKIKKDPHPFSLVYKAGFLDIDVLKIKEKVVNQLPEYDITVLYMLMGLAGMIKYIILTWYLKGMEKDAEEMADMCSGFSSTVIAKIREVDPEFIDRVSAILENQ